MNQTKNTRYRRHEASGDVGQRSNWLRVVTHISGEWLLSAMRVGAFIVCVSCALQSRTLVAGTFSHTYLIDPTRSSLSSVGTVFFGGSRPIEEQQPGSLTSSVLGTINAATSSGSIAIQGATISAPNKPGPFLPGNVSGAFAGVISNFTPGLDAFGVFRDPVFQISLPTQPVMPDGTFSLDSLSTNYMSGEYVFQGIISGTAPLGPDPTLVQTEPLVGRITRNGLQVELEVRLNALATLPNGDTSGLVGTIIATADLAPTPVQWFPEDGGNGNYYTVIPNTLVNDPLDWDTARAYAESLTYLGQPGRLVAIETIAENLFLTETFGDDLHYKWIGGYQTDGANEPEEGWMWTNGLPVMTGAGTPATLNNSSGTNENENRLVFDGGVSSVGKSWNDLPSRFGTSGLVVEFAAVPELSSVSLAGIGFTIFALSMNRYRSRRSSP